MTAPGERTEAECVVQCECGYTVEALTAEQAFRFAAQHQDDEHETVIRYGGASR